MSFPFSITRTIVLDQDRYRIPPEAYLFHQIGADLSYLDMDMSRVNDNELLLQKTELVRTLRQKDMLRIS